MMSRGPEKWTKGVNLVGDVLRAWRESQDPPLSPRDVADLMGVDIGHYRLHESSNPRRFRVAPEKFLKGWLNIIPDKAEREFWRVEAFAAKIKQTTDSKVLNAVAGAKDSGLEHVQNGSGLREEFRLELDRQMKIWRPGLYRQIDKTLNLSRSMLEDVVDGRSGLSHMKIASLAKLVGCSPHQWLMMAGYLPANLENYFKHNPIVLDFLADMDSELIGEFLESLMQVVKVGQSSKKKKVDRATS